MAYVIELEREISRLHRRRMWPVWVFAGLVAVGCGIAWLHHEFPQAPVPFVQELR